MILVRQSRINEALGDLWYCLIRRIGVSGFAFYWMWSVALFTLGCLLWFGWL